MSANEHDAATPVEDQHPSVDQSAENLKEYAVDPAPDSEGQMSNIDDPNENSGTDFAVPSKEQPEDPVKDVIDKWDGENDELPGQGEDQDDVPFPESRDDLYDNDGPERKSAIIF